MINIIITGFNGAMGKNLVELIDEIENLNISAGIDREINSSYSFPQYQSFSKDIKGDVLIDFSHYLLIPSLLDFIEEKKIPAVICTTGISKELENRISEISKFSPIFRSENMSLGINLLINLVNKAAEILRDSFDIEIIEKHHNKKLDSPSGTAFMIAREINDTLDNSKKFVSGREGNNSKREENEIGIHSVRGGTIVGEHQVIFAGNDETIKIEHIASSKKVFAQGALKAALFILNKKMGIYSMKDII